ncbi:MAG: tetratricopeptide repeat protein [Deltaproteobacteria bacterium]|nr:tetratricopeptide repeat protein [Deltaproteobacteria bacterium]
MIKRATIHGLLALALLGPGPLAAQPAPEGGEKEDGYTPRITGPSEVPETPREVVETGKPKKPRISAEDLYRVRPTQSEAKLQAAIESLYSIIDYSPDDDPEKPGYLARLANLYWEKAESYFMKAYSPEMDQEITAAIDSGDPEQRAAAEARRQRQLDLQVEWRQKAIKIFQEIEAKYADYPKLDMVLFFLGNFLTQMGQSDEGYRYYEQLITRFPTSEYLPDTLVNIGDYYFDQNDYMTAMGFLERVEKFKEHRIFGYALYKRAWCHYNMGEYEDAFKGFVRVIEHSLEIEKAGKTTRIGLKNEAQKDLVLAYSQVGQAGQAIPFFFELAPEIYLSLAAQLANLYLDQGEPRKSIDMYKYIIDETIRKEPQSPLLLTYQRAIVDASDRLANKLETRKEVKRLVELYTALQERKDPIIDQERPRMEDLLGKMAVLYHLEAQKLGDRKTMLLAQEVYDHYLNLFPDAGERYNMTMNLAILHYQLEDFEAAVKRYEEVLAMDPRGPHAEEAAYTSLLAYYKLIDVKGGKIKEEEQDIEDAAEKEIPPLYASMIRACDRYVEMKPGDEEQVAQARFASAKIYYDFNHYPDAATRFTEIIERWPEHENSPDSAKMLLSSFMMMRDIRSMNAWAEKLYAIPSLAQGDLLVIINKIRDRAQFNQCFEFEFDKQYERAAGCFLTYARNFSTSNLVDKAYYNAALNYQRAKKFLLALEANAGLYSCCSRTSDLGPRALYLIADTFRMAGVYDQAAINFEKYVEAHPKSPKNQEALVYASKFRRSLGQYKEAIADYKTYIRRFPQDPKVPAVYFDMGMLYKKQNDHKQAIVHFQTYLDKYRNRGGVNYLLAAYQEIGDSLLKTNQKPRAQKMFLEVIEVFKALPAEEKKTIDARGLSSIAWAFFNLGDEAYKEAVDVKLTRQKLKENTEKKIAGILKAQEYYLTVLALKHPYWTTAALARIGSAWQRFATEFENSPLPPGLTPDEQEFYKLQLTEEAGKFRKQASDAYKRCLEEAVKSKVFNEFTEKAEKELSVLEFQFSGMKEYRARPEYFGQGTNPPGFRLRPVELQSKRVEEEAAEPPPEEEPGEDMTPGDDLLPVEDTTGPSVQ